MMKIIQRGENLVINNSSGIVTVAHDIDHRLDINLTAFLVTDSGKVLDDSGIVYYNQPNGPLGVATFITPTDSGITRYHKIKFDWSKAPLGVTKIFITLTEDNGIGFAKVKNFSAEVHTNGEIIKLSPSTFETEIGVIVLELYIKNGQSKVRSVWQGFSSGLEALCRNYGVDVEDKPKISPVVQPLAPIQPSTTLSLKKVRGKVNLSKGQRPILIEKSPEITASISWQTGTDYDIYALVYTKDGKQFDIATFGAGSVPPLRNFGNGAVEHMGDVGRGGDKIKTETIKIRLNDNIFAIVPVAYSAQSNGTGSFRRYMVSMLIDNHCGTAVSISAKNANNDETIYTCVPGIITNTPHGVVIDAVEYYSRPGSENRPKLVKNKADEIEIIMDAGPKNNYK